MNIIIKSFRQIDWRKKPHLGEQYIGADGRLYGRKYCDICRATITWVDKEPNYCFEPSVTKKWSGGGTSQCQDWVRMKEEYLAKRSEQSFLTLLDKGLVK